MVDGFGSGSIYLEVCLSGSSRRNELRKQLYLSTSSWALGVRERSIADIDTTIMTAHTEDELKALKVVDLKHLLSEANLPTSGRKEELIARLLDSKPTENLNSESAAAIDEQDSNVVTVSDETKTSEKINNTAIPAADATSSVQSVESPEKTTSTKLTATASEEKAASGKELEEEIEKRKSRAARFGVPYVDSKNTTLKPKTNIVPPPKPAVITAKPTSRKVAEPGPAKMLDPIEEEKKRKRLEKFGPVRPAAEEKKAKTTA